MENDNVIPMSSRAIDLPVSPLRATSAEGELMHAPVVATLMQDKTIAGRLIGVDGPRAIISLEARNKHRVYIRFTELRYLNFITRNPVNRARHPLQKDHAADILMPRSAQEFRITFTDQKVLSGRTRSSFVDRIGIHLFQLVDSSHVSRLFIPTQAVARYYIGERRDQDRPKGIAPHAEKEAPRRRKADRSRTDATAGDTESLCAALARREDGGDSLTAPKRIGEMLVEDGIITQEQLDATLDIQRRGGTSGDRIGEILVASGAASAEQIYAALAHKFGMPFVLLRNFFIEIECLNLVPADIARRYTLVPLLVHRDRLIVAMDDPANTEALTLLRFMTQYRIEPAIATRADIEWAIAKYYGSLDHTRRRAAGRSAPRNERNRKTMEKAVASFIANTISDAVSRNAADIRFVTRGERAELLFRIDGALVRIRRFSRIIMPAISARLHAMAGLEPQAESHPGQARVLDGHEVVDIRIALDGSDDDASATIELVRTGARIESLDQVGLPPDELGLLREGLGRRGRLLVVAGPRDSHRARTMYAALRELKDAGRRVATAEWPVSYYLNGIEQAHPDSGTDDGFPLAILDELRESGIGGILLGEIGSRARLKGAVGTALRGISVIAKLEALTAAHALAMLMEQAPDRVELGSALAGILVQHRVRVNCRYCLVAEAASPEQRAALGASEDEVFYHGAGCDACRHTGFNGSQSVFEFLPNSLELAALIESGSPQAQIAQWIRSSAGTALVDNALRLARLRRIPLAEAHHLQLAVGKV